MPLLFGLKSKIFFTLVIVLAVGMVLIDLVMTATLQKEFLKTEHAKGNLVIDALEQRLLETSGSPPDVVGEWLQRELVQLRTTIGFTEAIIVDTTGRMFRVGLPEAGFDHPLDPLARKALETRIRERDFFGTTWGVFWKADRYMALSAPLYAGGQAVAAVSMSLSLEEIYRQLREIQQIIFVYILINTGILAIVGFARIASIAVRPVHRLLKRAETFQEDDALFFLTEKGENEFNRLSKALNRLFQKITDDRETLRETVQTLERTNIDLKQAQKDIVQAEKLASVGRLSSGIAHEIGNPIGIVIGYLDLIKQSNPGAAERAEYIERAEAEIHRISSIIRQLLDFSRPSSGEPEEVSVHELLEDIVSVVRLQPLMAGVEITLELTAAHDIVRVDPNQLRQVFLNLIINAADAVTSEGAERDGMLTIRSAATGTPDSGAARIQLLFVDNGPGIPEAHLDTIFDPFFTTKEPGKGTGLGLSVSFMLIENMGGRIAAGSAPGEGTTMTILLPLVEHGRGAHG